MVSVFSGGLIQECAGRSWRLWRVADESFGMGEIGGCQDGRPAGLDGWGVAVVDVGGGVQAEAAVAVLVVIPGEEVLAVGPGGLD